MSASEAPRRHRAGGFTRASPRRGVDGIGDLGEVHGDRDVLHACLDSDSALARGPLLGVRCSEMAGPASESARRYTTGRFAASPIRWAPSGTGTAPTSRSFPSAPRVSSCACSPVPGTPSPLIASASGSRPTRCGTSTSPTCVRGSSTDFASTARTSPKKACVSIPRSSWRTPTRRPSPAASTGATPSSDTPWATRGRTSPAIHGTARRSFRSVS
jgi:hypothetical protein